MSTYIPTALYKNDVSQILDEIKYSYGILTRKGVIHWLITIDQDAKIIAVDSRFDKKLNYWDLSSIGAALHGVAREGQDFFETESLIRATLIFKDVQLFVKPVGLVELPRKGSREILMVLLVDKDVNIGIIILQMKKFAQKIREAIERSNEVINKLEMNEDELKRHLKQLKSKVFNSI